MAYWLEIHCDVKASGVNGLDENQCHTLSGNNVMDALSDNGAADLNAMRNHLTRLAKEKGWKFSRTDGWACPWCARQANK